MKNNAIIGVLPNSGQGGGSYAASFRYGGLFQFSVYFSYPGLFSFSDPPFVRLEQDTTENIRKDFPVFFAPQIGAVIYNFELLLCKVNSIFKSKEGFEIRPLDASTAPRYLAESIAPFYHRQNGIVGIKEEKRPKPFKKIKPIILEGVKDEKTEDIDPWENACEATLQLLEKDNPALAKAIKSKRPNECRAKGFAADTVRRMGFGLDGFSLNDAQFVSMIAQARQDFDQRAKRKSRVNSIDWHIAHPLNWYRYYPIKDLKEIARLISEETDTSMLSDKALDKRIRKLRLVRDVQPGAHKR